MVTKKQLLALSAAEYAATKQGLERSGSVWVDPIGGTEGHSHRTICSLVDRGLLQLWCDESVAHITDSGQRTLKFAREDLAAPSVTASFGGQE